MGTLNPNANIRQTNSQGPTPAIHSPPHPSASVPAALQAGNPGGRPTVSSVLTAPILPTAPLSASASLLSANDNINNRPATMSSSHSYSRSSPGLGSADQKYVPFSGTPEVNRYTGNPIQKYYTPQTPTGAPSQSPLALADIRPPRPEPEIGNEILSPNPYMSDGGGLTQTNCSYLAPWAIYAYDWCNWPVNTGASAGKMAICSYLEDPHNFIQILDTQIEAQDGPGGTSAYGIDFTRIAEATCSYPVTRILWEPPSQQKQTTDLLATSGDHLRLWSLPPSPAGQMSNTITRSSNIKRKQPPPQKLTPLALLSNSKTPEHTAPLTSLDWNTLSPKLIITSSIDTTCTIWDIPTLTAKTQLIAHDKEVFDVRFCAGSVDTFVSCGADGSVRMFDLRSLEHSTIIYEPSEKGDQVQSPEAASPGGNQQTLAYSPPLLRLAASPHDSHLLATFAADSKIIRILDHRQPGQALLELHGHSSSINSIEWSPTRRGMLASGGDDSLVLYWDLINAQNSAVVSNVNGGVSSPDPQQQGGSGAPTAANAKGPTASWRCDYEVGNLSWSPSSQLTNQGGDWLGVTGGRAVWGVKL